MHMHAYTTPPTNTHNTSLCPQDYLAAGARGSDAVWDAARSVEAGGDAAELGQVGYNQAFEQVRLGSGQGG